MRKHVPGMDSAKAKDANEQQPFTQKDFESALKKAARKLSDQK